MPENDIKAIDKASEIAKEWGWDIETLMKCLNDGGWSAIASCSAMQTAGEILTVLLQLQGDEK